MKKTLVPSLAAGFGALVVSLVMGFLSGALFPGLMSQYNNTSLFRPWSDPLMSLYFVHPFIIGAIMTVVWQKIKDLVKGKTLLQRGLMFGFWYFAITTLPGMFISYASFPLSLLMVASWTVSSLLQILTAGPIIAKLNR